MFYVLIDQFKTVFSETTAKPNSVFKIISTKVQEQMHVFPLKTYNRGLNLDGEFIIKH